MGEAEKTSIERCWTWSVISVIKKLKEKLSECLATGFTLWVPTREFNPSKINFDRRSLAAAEAMQSYKDCDNCLKEIFKEAIHQIVKLLKKSPQ